jgi:hypothetical protein
MAKINKIQKKRFVFYGVLILVVAIWVMADKDLRQFITGPDLPGYALKAPSGEYTNLDWKMLQQGKWPYGKTPVINKQIIALSGKKVCLKGFMLPLHDAGPSSQFFIAEQPRGCYFCNPPGIAEVAQINIANNKQINITDWPVCAYGILKVAAGKPDDKMMYTIDDVVVTAQR